MLHKTKRNGYAFCEWSWYWTLKAENINKIWPNKQQIDDPQYKPSVAKKKKKKIVSMECHRIESKAHMPI